MLGAGLTDQSLSHFLPRTVWGAINYRAKVVMGITISFFCISMQIYGGIAAFVRDSSFYFCVGSLVTKRRDFSMKKNIFKGLMAAVVGLTLAACGSSNASKNQLVVGMEAGYPPFNWTQQTDANGAVKIQGTNDYAGGYDVEIAKRVAQKLDKELVIVKTEWDGLTPGVVSGKLDAIIAGMSPTAERKEAIDFSDNYYKSQLVLVVKKGSQYENAKTLADFAGAKVTGQLNTFHYSVIDQIPGVQKQPAMDNFPAMRVALQSGTIDAYVSELPEGVSAESANSDFVMVKLIDGFQASSEDTDTAIGLQKNSPLKDAINKALSEISESERQQLMDEAIKNQPASN